MYENIKGIYCTRCSEKNEKDYKLIIEHLRQEPGATVLEVILATKVTLKSVNCLIDEGRISYVENSDSDKEKTIEILEDIGYKREKFHVRRKR